MKLQDMDGQQALIAVGKRLRAAVLSSCPVNTKTNATDLVRRIRGKSARPPKSGPRKGWTMDMYVSAILIASDHVHKVRIQRQYRKPNAPIDKITRRAERAHGLIFQALSDYYRMPQGAGDFELKLRRGSPHINTYDCINWNAYSNCKYPGTDRTWTLTADNTLWAHTRDLLVVDGLLTLSIEPLEHDRYEAYKASWLRQGRALSDLWVERGYIVRHDGHTAHGATLGRASSTLIRRLNTDRLNDRIPAVLAQLTDNPPDNWLSTRVTVRDSVLAGNCKAGTEQYRDRYFPGRSSATVRDILCILDQRSLAVKACAYAITRKHVQSVDRLSA